MNTNQHRVALAEWKSPLGSAAERETGKRQKAETESRNQWLRQGETTRASLLMWWCQAGKPIRRVSRVCFAVCENVGGELSAGARFHMQMRRFVRCELKSETPCCGWKCAGSCFFRKCTMRRRRPIFPHDFCTHSRFLLYIPVTHYAERRAEFHERTGALLTAVISTRCFLP